MQSALPSLYPRTRDFTGRLLNDDQPPPQELPQEIVITQKWLDYGMPKEEVVKNIEIMLGGTGDSKLPEDQANNWRAILAEIKGLPNAE